MAATLKRVLPAPNNIAFVMYNDERPPKPKSEMYPTDNDELPEDVAGAPFVLSGHTKVRNALFLCAVGCLSWFFLVLKQATADRLTYVCRVWLRTTAVRASGLCIACRGSPTLINRIISRNTHESTDNRSFVSRLVRLRFPFHIWLLFLTADV